MEALLNNKLIAIDKSFSKDQKHKLEEAIVRMGGRVVERNAGAEYFVVEKIVKDLDDCLGVTSAWIYMLQKHLSWVEPRSFSPHCEKIMSGFRVWVMNNVGKADKAIIYACVEHLGGTACFDKERNLSHCVAEVNDPIVDVLIKQGVKVVVPEYFGDCFRLGMICPPQQYLFPDVQIRNCDLKVLLSNATLKYQKPEIRETNPGLFEGKVFYVDTSLFNAKNPKPLWLDNIETLGGKVVGKLESAKTLVTETRGELFEKALSFDLEIGTKRWIRDQIKNNTLVSPLAAVLHYPYPLSLIAEMKACVISVTNYVGEPREDIASMATRMGAKFTRNLTKENTHIICGDCKGEKFARAKEWNLHTINHLWLEESYSKWQFQREGKERYISFPPCLNDLVNKMAVKNFKTVIESNSADIAANNGQISISAESVNEKAPKRNDSFKQESKAAFLETNANTNTNSEKIEEKATFMQITPPELRNTTYESLDNGTENICKHKRSSEGSTSNPPNADTVGMIAAFTGLRLLPEEEAIFDFLKIRITDNLARATILIVEKMSRTEKFLLAISYCIPIVSSVWKDRVINDRKMIPWEDYLLCDPEGEKILDFSLKKSIKTSRETNIFKGITLYCTKSVLPSKNTISRLVEANGGDFGEEITRRNVQRIREVIESSDDKTICLSTADDGQLITKLGIKCYNTEWLLNSILTQELKNLEEYLLLQ